MSGPEAGWRDDPTGRHEKRYWDGAAWTDHVADGQTTATDPVGTTDAPVASPAPRAPAGGRAVVRDPRWWIALIALPLAVLVGASFIPSGDGDRNAFDFDSAFDDDGSDVDLEPGDAGEDSDSDGDGTGDPGEPAALRVVDSGWSSSFDEFFEETRVVFAAVVENPNDDQVAQFVQIRFVFTDADGTVVDTQDLSVTNILAGGTAAVAGELFGDASDVTDMEVRVSTDFWEDPDEVGDGAFTAEGVETVADEDFGSLRTTGSLVSSFETDADAVEVVAIYRNNAGAIVGGATGFLNFVPAGGRAAFELTSGFVIEGVASTDIFATAAF